jgi:hypothetical protein
MSTPEPSPKKITTKIGGKRRGSSPSPTPRKTIKSRIGGAKASRENSPTPDAQARVESQEAKEEPNSQAKELSAAEKAIEKRKQLERELEEKRAKEVNQDGNFEAILLKGILKL